MLERSGPSFQEVIDQLILSGGISRKEAKTYLANHRFFEKRREVIKAKYPTGWVAVVNRRLYHGASLQELETLIQPLPRSNRAYIEPMNPHFH